MNILMVAPFNPNGRYNGGISSIANDIYTFYSTNNNKNISICKFETCRVKRKQKEFTKFNFLNIFNFIKCYSAIRKEYKKSNAEIIYFHSSCGIALLKDLLIIKHFKRKYKDARVVLHIHFADFDKIVFNNKFVRNKILDYINLYVDDIVFLSQKTLDEFNVKCRKHLVYNYTKQNKIVKFEKENNPKHILFVGSLDKRKGIIDLLIALKDIKLPFVLDVCGNFTDSDVEKEYKKYTNNMTNVLYHGFVNGERKEQIFSNASIFILPSYGEGLPIVILEALSYGCYIISTKVGAIPEIVNNNCFGKLIEPGDVESLRKNIEQAMCNNINVEEISKYGKSFSFMSFIEKFEHIIMK